MSILWHDAGKDLIPAELKPIRYILIMPPKQFDEPATYGISPNMSITALECRSPMQPWQSNFKKP